MPADQAAGRRAQHPVTVHKMAGDTADDGAFQAARRIGGTRATMLLAASSTPAAMTIDFMGSSPLRYPALTAAAVCHPRFRVPLAIATRQRTQSNSRRRALWPARPFRLSPVPQSNDRDFALPVQT